MFGTDDNMEWTRLELSIEDDLNKQKIIPDISSTGLDVTAEMMHDSFLTNLPHLDEVKISHMSMMSEISDAIESDKFLSRDFPETSALSVAVVPLGISGKLKLAITS